MATLAQLETILQAAGESYHRLPLQSEAVALITQRGGRVLGLFLTPDSENLFWTNSAAFVSLADFQAFVAAGNWNLGGERIWIAPEIQYNVRDRNDFWGTLAVSPAMDPGAFRLLPGGTGAGKPFVNITDTEDLTLTAHNLASGEQLLFDERLIEPVPDPLRNYYRQVSLSPDVRYAGYRQQVFLDGERTTAYSAVWNLVQLNAGGELLIPCQPVVAADDYFGTVPLAARQLHQGDVPHLRLPITGKQQYKVGYQAFSMTGRMGYWHTLPDGQAYLLIRSFFNNPSNHYPEEPPDKPGVNGHSVHVYNDGGEFGGAVPFGEMECTGQSVHRDDLQVTTEDTFLLWAYAGAPAAIRQIAHLLLGVRL